MWFLDKNISLLFLSLDIKLTIHLKLQEFLFTLSYFPTLQQSGVSTGLDTCFWDLALDSQLLQWFSMGLCKRGSIGHIIISDV